ncbi:MAG: hypothetical protein ACRD3O_24155, partial [Terriglobia bacterium]
AESKLTDPVIRDDLAGAISIIQERAHYLASRGGQDSGSSIEQAVRLYFLPAIHPPSASSRGSRQAHIAPAETTIRIVHVELNPDRTRALARVIFEDSVEFAHYRMALEKAGKDWRVATVWLGSEEEEPVSQPAGKK